MFAITSTPKASRCISGDFEGGELREASTVCVDEANVSALKV
jgi:hypothetical protein